MESLLTGLEGVDYVTYAGVAVLVLAVSAGAEGPFIDAE